MKHIDVVAAGKLVIAVAILAGCSSESYLSNQPTSPEASTQPPTFSATADIVPSSTAPLGSPGDELDCAPATPVPGKSNTVVVSQDIEPGKVTVIFALPYTVRLGADKRSVTSSDCALQNAVNDILKRHNLENASDFTGSGEFPTAQNKSMFSFQFPRTANTLAISNEIFALPGVSAAYPSVLSTPG